MTEAMTEAYDPLDYGNLARSVVDALLDQERTPLPPPTAFTGAGVYAIYYTALLDYRDETTAVDVPIYVGKAVPPGGRKGSTRTSPHLARTLHLRLRDHAKSISQARNLSLSNAQCRYLVVVPVWISLAERFLLSHFRPIWNTVIDGFGNHDPGRGRRNSARPRWDIVHPGRAWAERLAATESRDQIIAEVLSR